MGEHYPLQEVCLAVICGTPLLAGILVGLRFYARRKPGYKLDWDDWLIGFALMLSFALIGPSYKYVKVWHIGVHIWNVNPNEQEPDYDQYYFVWLGWNLINILILPLIKASIIILLLRIGSIIPWIRKALHVVMVFNVVACLIPWVVMIFMCPPQTGNTWKPRTFGGLRCVSQHRIKVMLVFINCANLFTDLLIFPIPYLIMRRATYMSKWARLVVVLLFASSLAVTAIGGAKIYTSYHDRLYALYKPDWTYPIDFCINHIENNVAISVACVPALRHMIRGWTSSNTIGNSRRTSGGPHVHSNWPIDFRWSASMHSEWRIRRMEHSGSACDGGDPRVQQGTVTSSTEVTGAASSTAPTLGGGGSAVLRSDGLDEKCFVAGPHHRSCSDDHDDDEDDDLDLERGIRVTHEVELTSADRNNSHGDSSETDRTWRSSGLTLTNNSSSAKRGSTTTMGTATTTTTGHHHGDRQGAERTSQDGREKKEMFVEEEEVM